MIRLDEDFIYKLLRTCRVGIPGSLVYPERSRREAHPPPPFTCFLCIFKWKLAIAGNAKIIITRNIRDFSKMELTFPDLKIITPGDFIKEYST
jgi:hypothetical protein